MNNLVVFTSSCIMGVILAACGGGAETSSAVGPGSNPSQLGATSGGVQDMSFARRLVREGKVPPAEAFIVEAMFSEHDLPVDGPACTTTLCLRGAMGIAPDSNENQAAWVQVGMSSTIDPNSYQRTPITIIATVDVSGSMGWSAQGNDIPLNTAKSLLHAIHSQLNETDQFALVSYGSTVNTPLNFTTGSNPSITSAINALSAGGSTYMEAGLNRAYVLAEQARQESNNVRVLLFTDEQPNVGATTPSEFEQIVSAGSDSSIGLSIFGIGLGLRADLLQAMSYMKGANAFSVMQSSEVEMFMNDNWPWMVSPIAHDLSVTAIIPDGLTISNTYGFPNNSTQQEVGFDVASIFLSKRKGALLLKLTGNNYENASVNLDLSYEEVDGLRQELNIDTSYDGQALDGNGWYMPQIGIAKTVTLAKLVSSMKQAATLYGTDQEGAIALLANALQHLNVSAAAIQDPDISNEAEFWPALLTLMEQGAEQGNFYGQF